MCKKYLSLDIELLCNKNGIDKQKGSLIELGACVFTEDGNVIDEFSTMIKPLSGRKLSEYGSRLLGINQADIDEAPTFREAAAAFDAWQSKYADDVEMWMSWGDVDYVKLRESYSMAKINLPKSLTRVFYDAQIGYQRKQFVHYRIGLNDALETEGAVHSLGTHRALDDAKKIPLIISSCI